MSSFFYRNFKRHYPVVESAQGVWVRDQGGREYLDGCSGAISANLGHGLPEINEAIQSQLNKVAFAHTSQFVCEAGLELAQLLVGMLHGENSPRARVYFTSGGSESLETALKMARSYYFECGQPKRHIAISRWQSYHGSTLGALAVTGHPARRKPYVPLFKDQPHVSPAYPYRCKCGVTPDSCISFDCTVALANELEETILGLGPENVMSFVAEPIVGAALGAAVPGQEYWRYIRSICTKYGVLLIADEVMTGLGRAGANFALDLWNVQADIIALGKGLSAGYMPLGAVIASGPIVEAFEQGSGAFEHGFTYSGHPVASAAGLAALRYLKRHNLVNKVKEQESSFFSGLDKLRQFDFIGDVRGRGFMAGLELVKDKKTKEAFPAEMRVSQIVAREAFRNGLMIYPGAGSVDGTNGDHIMIAPPFVISELEMSELFARLENVLEIVANELQVK